MQTKYVCRGLISLYVNFHSNRTMQSTSLHVKICRWGGEGQRAGVGKLEKSRGAEKSRWLFFLSPPPHTNMNFMV